MQLGPEAAATGREGDGIGRGDARGRRRRSGPRRLSGPTRVAPMEGNRDEAEKCISIARAALEAGHRERALRFLHKAQKLYPSPAARGDRRAGPRTTATGQAAAVPGSRGRSCRAPGSSRAFAALGPAGREGSSGEVTAWLRPCGGRGESVGLCAVSPGVG